MQNTASATVWCPSNLRIIKEELEGAVTCQVSGKAISQAIDPWSYASSDELFSRAQTILLRGLLCRFRHSDALGNLEAPEKLANWGSILEARR